ncbi:hypothetical protein EVAR_34025_1 [Eumeta japonica]|uniref:Uncharacterized protein n=1 Tax=Eumeta variegata TaxID=151549 RepID=A0A4C1VTA6_EUMVA|nr:hypothetical protein EVAR_34025_1 [Eumeta japonica]
MGYGLIRAGRWARCAAGRGMCPSTTLRFARAPSPLAAGTIIPTAKHAPAPASSSQILNLDRLFCGAISEGSVRAPSLRAGWSFYCCRLKHVLIESNYCAIAYVNINKCVQCNVSSAEKRCPALRRRKDQFLSMSGDLVHVN